MPNNNMLLTPILKRAVFDVNGVLIQPSADSHGRLTAAEVINHLRKIGISVYFLTNGCSTAQADIVQRLAKEGIQSTKNDIFTAAMTTAYYISNKPGIKRIHVIGSTILREQISTFCGKNIVWSEPHTAEFIIVSRDKNLNKVHLTELAGSKAHTLIATCRDTYFPQRDHHEIGPAPTVKRVERAMQRRAFVIGKPNPFVLTKVMKIPPQELPFTLVIGDTLDQDIQLGKNAGCQTVLFKQKKTTFQDNFPAGLRPDYIINKLEQLLSIAGERVCA